MIRVGSLLAAAVCLATQTSLVSATELKIYSTIGVQAAMKELGPVFEKQTGDKLDFKVWVPEHGKTIDQIDKDTKLWSSLFKSTFR